MSTVIHLSAKAPHYDKEAKTYDLFNENNSIQINQTIEKILRKYKVKTVLDLTCGTGSQVFWLAKCGYTIVGSDININMLKIAKAKSKKEKLQLKFIKSDMRTALLGQFDSIITIFNNLTNRKFLNLFKHYKFITQNS